MSIEGWTGKSIFSYFFGFLFIPFLDIAVLLPVCYCVRLFVQGQYSECIQLYFSFDLAYKLDLALADNIHARFLVSLPTLPS